MSSPCIGVDRDRTIEGGLAIQPSFPSSLPLAQGDMDSLLDSVFHVE